MASNPPLTVDGVPNAERGRRIREAGEIHARGSVEAQILCVAPERRRPAISGWAPRRESVLPNAHREGDKYN